MNWGSWLFGFAGKATARGILLFALLGFVSPAWAALGDNSASVQADSARMNGALRSTSNARYTIQEIRTSNGQTVREFVSPGGSVFGVAWDGPTTPDLQQLLGSYFEQFRQASEQRQHPPRGPLAIETPTLVVQQSGHLRAFRGRAYLPTALPSGVQSSEIQ
ncbi:MAG: DUF2844 domain-containing protein [Acidobacteriota bacterium]|nr:DUF2844 domain-containing protein [Acidobacteriota bacterium]